MSGMIRRIGKIAVTFFNKIKFSGKCKIGAFTNTVIRKCDFEGKNALGVKTYLSGTSFGYGSYTGFCCEFSNCIVGRYCSIGNYVRVVSATHPTDMVSTYPAFYSDKYRVSYVNNSKFTEHITTDNGYDCEIGNDVWIGDNVLIKGGTRIGDGAVVAMGSVVVGDVEPYTVVGGVPARAIKKRFDEETIKRLMAVKWWDKPYDWVSSHAEGFDNPEVFVKLFEDKVVEKKSE